MKVAKIKLKMQRRLLDRHPGGLGRYQTISAPTGFTRAEAVGKINPHRMERRPAPPKAARVDA